MVNHNNVFDDRRFPLLVKYINSINVTSEANTVFDWVIKFIWQYSLPLLANAYDWNFRIRICQKSYLPKTISSKYFCRMHFIGGSLAAKFWLILLVYFLVVDSRRQHIFIIYLDTDL